MPAGTDPDPARAPGDHAVDRSFGHDVRAGERADEDDLGGEAPCWAHVVDDLDLADPTPTDGSSVEDG